MPSLTEHHYNTINNVRVEVQATKDKVACALELLGRRHPLQALQARNEVLDHIEPIRAAIDSCLLKLQAPDPSLCRVTGNIALALTGERSTVTLTAIDYMRKACKVPVTTLGCQCVGGNVNPEILKSGENRYIISYQPMATPHLKLSITLEGRHVVGSPFTIVTRPPPTEGVYCPLTFRGAEGSCRLADKGLRGAVVSESQQNQISLFRAFGSKRHSFGSYGCEEGQFDSPRGVTVDGMGNILVADCGNHRIQKFTAKGTFMTSVGGRGNGSLQFNYPSDITFSMTNNKMYVADRNHRVQILNSGLAFYKTCWNTYSLRVASSNITFAGTFGSLGVGQGEFNDPQGITCDSTGKVYVADSGNYRVQVFTAEGDFLWMFKVLGTGNETVRYPIAIAIDKSNRVYVEECGCISVCTSQGEWIESLNRGNGEFTHTSGLAVSRIGVLYSSNGDGIKVAIKRSFIYNILRDLTIPLCFLLLLWWGPKYHEGVGVEMSILWDLFIVLLIVQLLV
jgi:DNA-binding beta-propeller fold protein YncE